MKKVQLALIGAGNRGQGIFGQYALDQPHRAQFVAVVEPDQEKRENFRRLHQLPPAACFADSAAFFAAPPPELDGVVIATLEDQRLELIAAAMRRHWAILCEKPLCTNPADLLKLEGMTADYDNIILVCHQMRLTPIYRTIKSLLDSGRYGKPIAFELSENLAYSHMAHSFVRGLFNNSKLTPMLLAKSCHDMDLITYLMKSKAVHVSSFGSLSSFRKENCPPGAPKYCLEGCPASATCPFDVLKLYFNDDTDAAYLRQMGVIRNREQLREALTHNQFGRCVYQCDNDVVDHQHVQIEFADGATAGFTLSGHNAIERRRLKISLTNGEIEYDGIRPEELKLWSFEPALSETIHVKSDGTHSGGDRAIMNNFVDAIATGDKSHLLTPIQRSIDGHLLVFAAETARWNGQVVNLAQYRQSLKPTPTK